MKTYLEIIKENRKNITNDCGSGSSNGCGGIWTPARRCGGYGCGGYKHYSNC